MVHFYFTSAKKIEFILLSFSLLEKYVVTANASNVDLNLLIKSLGAVQIIRDAFLALFGPPPPCDILYVFIAVFKDF